MLYWVARVKPGKYENLEKVLYQWFFYLKTTVKTKAAEVAQKLRIEDFTPSNKWVDQFLICHGIVYKKIYRESAAVNAEDADFWKTVFLGLLKTMSVVIMLTNLVYFLKRLPDKSSALKDEQCHMGKLSKDCVTVLVCSNADGRNKCKPLVTGKLSTSPAVSRTSNDCSLIINVKIKQWIPSSLNIFLILILRCRSKIGMSYYS